VEGQIPSETKKGAGGRGGAGNVEAQGSPWSEWVTVREEETTMDDVEHSDLLAP
jgi:hypothetical protein